MADAPKLPSNQRIARQKKAQAGFSLVGGTLGLAALASRGKASKVTRQANRLGADHLFERASKWKDRSTALTTAGAGVGGVGAYNFASYTNADAKKQQKLKKNHDPFEIEKAKFFTVGEGGARVTRTGNKFIRPKKTNYNRYGTKQDSTGGGLTAFGERTALAATAAAGAGGGVAYSRKKKQAMAKASTVSAFGIDHGA